MTLLDALARYKQEPIRENEEALLAALTDAAVGSQSTAQASDTSTAVSVSPSDLQALTARVAVLETELSNIEALFRSAALQTASDGKG